MADIQTQYAIIGASAAGMAAAQGIREHDPGGTITVFSDESDSPYFRPMIPFLISGKKTAGQMTLSGQGPYMSEEIEILPDSGVVSFNSHDKTLTTEAGETAKYEKLLIATGSRPYIPPEIEGTDLPGVFAVRKLADARLAADRASTAKQAVMLGGGLLNLKVAFALLERNLEVTLVVRSPEVLSQLMEPADTGLIREALNNAGLKIETGVSAKTIIADGNGVSGVLLDSGREMPCQMVCIGKGVSPNVEFIDAENVNVDRGVVVDAYTRTNAPGVFAAGDVAVTFDPISGDRIMTGLWTNAAEMGRCAGHNMAGKTTEYSGTFGILNATQVAEQPFVSMGVVHTSGTDYETVVKSTKTAYRKVVFSPEGDRLVGVILIGDISRAGLYRLVIRERMPVGPFKNRIVNHTLHYGHLMLP